MIKTFRHKGLQAFFEKGSKAGIQPSHAAKLARQLARQLTRLDAAKTVEDMNVHGWKLHALTGRLARHHAVTVSGNWRLTFTFEEEHAVLVNYQDYH